MIIVQRNLATIKDLDLLLTGREMQDPITTTTPSAETGAKPVARFSDSRLAAVVTAAYVLNLTRQ
jgi:hypothetical protein